ncbi:amino acid adenylation domain-containing protein [Streptomyces sp. NBC_00140]|uniref:amino acid adenylation domain-containing protein n=1 Tax=Streptomyces sp. NBC_00140 TaxID=2975664 RepID=UPI002250E9BC|nr:amino acid adenylation domain-containing protein [Streptomyces sp. NBC_00140]MCX5337592.1 amino acid adenylation domain-containing protein [Streptomyces sp. NBC_00140]
MTTTASVRAGAHRRLTADTVVELVVRQAEQHPKSVAVRHGDRALTYGQLLSAAASMATALADGHGVGAGLRVGLATRRGIPQMVSVLAILMAGGCYVPLDPALPEQRLRGMIDDAGLKLLVSDDAYTGPRPPGAVIAAPRLSGERVQAGPVRLRPQASSEAYVLFTSGSTGRPKGVVMPHRPLVNLIEWQRASSTAGVGTRTLQFAPIGFDVSFQEIFSTWCSGGELVLIGEQDRRDPARVLELAHHHGVQRIFVPFAVLQSMADWAFDGDQDLPRLTEIITAGEQPIVTPALERFVELTGNPTLANQYGPTETHAATQSVLRGAPRDWPRVPPLGEVLDNCSVLLLDDSLTPVSEGTEGEICIAGISLADGYAVDDDRTRGRFVAAGHLDGIRRLYRTGDFGIVEDGVLLYRGRRDDQVKISGHRIEMGEVEAAVSAHPEVGQVAVVPVGDGPSTRHLVAFVVARRGTTPDEDGLRAFTARLLPAHAVPRRFLAADTLPRTATNKVDRRALAARATPAPAGEDGSPLGARETVRAVWQRALGRPVPDGARFFDVGGDSLTAVRLVVELNKHFARKISVGDLLLRPEFDACVAFFEATEANDDFRPRPAAGDAERGAWLPVALTQAHRMNREAWRARHGLPSISNVPMAYHLQGELDAGALETALRHFVTRHPALALEIDETPGAYRQRLTDWTPTLRSVRLDPQLSAEAARERALALVQEDAERPFVRSGPAYDGLLRATLIRIAEREHHLFLCADHIVFDGWSVGVLNEDLAVCYRAALRGEAPPAAEPDLRFLDWARAENAWLGEDLAATLRADFGRQPRVPEDPAAALLYPAIEPGPPAHYARETLIRRRLDADRTAAVHELARTSGHPMGSVLTALYATAFARWSGRDEVALVSTFANRTIPDADRSVGFFANNVPVFLGRAAGLSPAEMIDRAAREVGRAAQREAVPFPFWLATMLPGHEDLAGSARYAFLNVRSQDRSGLDRLELDGVTSRAVRVDIALTPSFALGLRAGDNGADIALELAFLPGLVAPERAEALMAELEDVVDGIGHPRGGQRR